MKVNEIRVGNFIKNSGVTVIVDSNYISDLELETLNSIHFKPILLTEEWLLKLGFRKLDKYSYTKNGFFIHYRVRKGSFIYSGKTKVKYLHHLQNLYLDIKNEELKVK